MSQLLRLFSASNALLFFVYPRFLGLVFARFLCYVAIYLSILVQARLPFLLFYQGQIQSPLKTSNFRGFFHWTGSVSTSFRSLSFFPTQFSKWLGYFDFDCHSPSEIIKLQGDWQSDASCLFRIISAAETACLSRYGIQVTVYVSCVILINSTNLLASYLLAYFSILLPQPTLRSSPVWAFWHSWFIVR